MAERKYYWLKLKRDFFKRHDVRIIEEMPNGKDYILFYLKLLLESVDHEGSLRFSDAIPYNEQMLSVVTNTNIDIVRAAMKLFVELNMIDIFDDKTIYMSEVEKLIGSETTAAERKRISRARQKSLEYSDNVTYLSQSVTQSKSIEKEKEKEIDTDLDEELGEELEDIDDFADENENVENFVDLKLEPMGGDLGKGVVLLTDAQRDALLEKLGLDGFNFYIDRLANYIIKKQAKINNHYKTILKWAKEDNEV